MSYIVVHPADATERTKYDYHAKREKKRNVKHFGVLDLNEIIEREDEQDLFLDDEVEEIFYQ